MVRMGNAAIRLRLARAHHIRAIAAMSRDLVESGLGWKYDMDRVAAILAKADTLTLVARDSQGLAGFAILYFGDERAHLQLLAVRPRCQRQGIGRRLLRWLIESARVAGMAEMGLEMRAGNQPARDFYRSLGFVDAGAVAGYYNQRESALRMRLVLRRPIESMPWQPPTLRRQ
jgi:[ribosomal protein S18]-alanine N-acetyltransferase